MKELGDYLLDKYGPRLSTADLAEVMGTTPHNVRNQISDEVFPIPTYKDGEAQSCPRYADVRDVVDYLNRRRPGAVQASQGQDGYNVLETSSRSARTSRRPRVPRNLAQTNARPPHV